MAGIFRRPWGNRPRRRRKIPFGKTVVSNIRTISPGGGNWSSTSTWVEGLVPVAANEVRANGSSGNLTVDVSSVCRSIDLTGYGGTMTTANSVTLTVGDGTAPTSNVAVKFPVTASYVAGFSNYLVLNSSSGASMTVDINGVSAFENVRFARGTYTLSSSVSVGGGFFQLGANTGGGNVSVDTNGQSINCYGITSDTSSGTIAFTLGASAIIVQDQLNLVSGVTLSAGTSLISMTASDGSGSFTGNGKTFYDVTLGAGTHLVHGSNTYHDFIMEEDCYVTFDASSTSTFTSFFSGGPSSGSPNSISSSSPGTFYTFTDASGTNSAQYTTITDSHAGGGATWDATFNCTDGGGNTGWTFPVTMKFIPWITEDVMA